MSLYKIGCIDVFTAFTTVFKSKVKHSVLFSVGTPTVSQRRFLSGGAFAGDMFFNYSCSFFVINLMPRIISSLKL